MKPRYHLPPLLNDASGQPRRAGFEFEFGNLPIIDTARSLQAALGGTLDIKSPFEAVLQGSSVGRLKVERDMDILKSVRYRRWLQTLGVDFGPGSIGHDIETNIDSASRLLVPCEVITDPIPFDQLQHLDSLLQTLTRLGAEGTQDSLIYAFGLHINASIPDSSAASLRRYLQAFLLLYTWIIETSGIDLTRRYFTRFIDPFPQAYSELVLDNDYLPTINELMADYLEHNPTRNRALDMLPIFCGLDEARVQGAISSDERKLVKGRPAFHYRLPDCRVNEPGWSAAGAWNKWVYVEQLAADNELLEELIGEWRACNSSFSFAPRAAWATRLTSLLAQKYFER
jgi:hypothetical protein